MDTLDTIEEGSMDTMDTIEEGSMDTMDTIEEGSMDLDKAVKFLKSYGYLPKAEEVTVKDPSDEVPEPVKSAIIRFQSNY